MDSMTSLTKISIVARKIVRYGIYLIILGIILRFVIMFGSDIWNQINPPKDPDPDIIFGPMDKLPFPIKNTPNNLSYELILPEGELPKFPIQVNVYKMQKAQSNIQVLENAKSKARNLGFNENGKELVKSVYVFEHNSEPSRLTMNIVNEIFSISYDIRANLSILGQLPPSAEEAEGILTSLLKRANSKPEDLSGPVTSQFLKIDDSELTKAISRSEADIVKINFYRKEYEKGIPSMTPDAIEANVWFNVAGSDKKSTFPIVGGEYHYYPIDERQKGTYPIITSQEAWDELNSGGGYIANLGDNDTNITIRRVYLGYYDAGQYTPYFQPIVVFEGDNDFFAYIPAIEKRLYAKEEEITNEK